MQPGPAGAFLSGLNPGALAGRFRSPSLFWRRLSVREGVGSDRDDPSRGRGPRRDPSLLEVIVMPSPDFSMVEPDRRPEVARRIPVAVADVDHGHSASSDGSSVASGRPYAFDIRSTSRACAHASETVFYDAPTARTRQTSFRSDLARAVRMPCPQSAKAAAIGMPGPSRRPPSGPAVIADTVGELGGDRCRQE